MSDRDSDFGAFLSGFVVGGLVGAAVALLMAPQSGEETRTVIKEKGIELRDMAAEKAEEVRTMAGEVADSAKSKAADLQKRGQVVLEEQKEKLSSALEAGKKAVGRGGSSDEGEEESAEA
ncbi:MAG TPA: YtxH domain-containing protein [Anaerolineales bacterium]|nr:YtxH domain-containing protein [Anaerolineales bacterium]